MYRTKTLLERLQLNSQDLFKGRRIIKTDSRINGGIYLGAFSREAIIVDDSYENSFLAKTYGALLNNFSDKNGELFFENEDELERVFNLVKVLLPYDSKTVGYLNRRFGFNNDVKVSLDFYILNKAGICRHQALFCSYLIEKLIDDGHIEGKVSVDRNTLLNAGHAFCRYTSKNREIYILDVALNHFARLGDDRAQWLYHRRYDLDIEMGDTKF